MQISHQQDAKYLVLRRQVYGRTSHLSVWSAPMALAARCRPRPVKRGTRQSGEVQPMSISSSVIPSRLTASTPDVALKLNVGVPLQQR
jgi:hypothetical protein